MKDIWGRMLINHYHGNSAPYCIVRDDGFRRCPLDVKVYFSEIEDWPIYEQKLLRHIQGKILDIGAGAGRHALYCQSMGNEVHAIDSSLGAVEVMNRRGVKLAYQTHVSDLNFKDDFFETVLMMFNNFGLAGTLNSTKTLLNKLDRMTSEFGRIIATCINPYWTEDNRHLSYHEQNRIAGRPAGQIRLKIGYRQEESDWFNLLLLSIDEVSSLIEETSWEIGKVLTDIEKGVYGLVLIKNNKYL